MVFLGKILTIQQVCFFEPKTRKQTAQKIFFGVFNFNFWPILAISVVVVGAIHGNYLFLQTARDKKIYYSFKKYIFFWDLNFAFVRYNYWQIEIMLFFSCAVFARNYLHKTEMRFDGNNDDEF
jgi:nitrate reductase NapE component